MKPIWLTVNHTPPALCGGIYTVSIIQFSMSNPREILGKIEELTQQAQALEALVATLRVQLAERYQNHVIVNSTYGHIVEGPMSYDKAKSIELETNLEASIKEEQGIDKAYRDLVTCVPWKWTDHEEFIGELVCPDLWDTVYSSFFGDEADTFKFSDIYPRSTFVDVKSVINSQAF